MLALVELRSGEVLYDLGSGDGCILILAAGKFNAKAVGYEVDEKLANKAADMVREFHLQDRVEVIHDDLFNADVGKADVVTLYLSPRGNQLVKTKLENELKPGARIISLEFEVPGWEPLTISKIVDGNLTYTIYLYKK